MEAEMLLQNHCRFHWQDGTTNQTEPKSAGIPAIKVLLSGDTSHVIKFKEALATVTCLQVPIFPAYLLGPV